MDAGLQELCSHGWRMPGNPNGNLNLSLTIVHEEQAPALKNVRLTQIQKKKLKQVLQRKGYFC